MDLKYTFPVYEPIHIERPMCRNCNQPLAPYHKNNMLILDGCETCDNKVIRRVIEVRRETMYLTHPAKYDCLVEYENSETGIVILDQDTINKFSIVCPDCERIGRSSVLCDNGCKTNYCPCGTEFYYDGINNHVGHDPDCGQ